MLVALNQYRLRIAAALAILLLITGAVWAVRYQKKEKQVREVTEKGSELAEEIVQRMESFANQASKGSSSPADLLAFFVGMRERMESLGKEMEQLPPAERAAVRKKLEKVMMQQFDKMAANLLQMPKKEQDATLDGWINFMELMRMMPRGGQQGNRGGMMGGGQPQNKNSTPEDRENRRRQFLDNTSPSERAHFSGAMQLLEQRRRARGLPPR